MGMGDEEFTCAVWYWCYKSVYYELFETEQDAATYAWALEDSGNGAVAGIQFSDGMYIDRDNWAEYAAEGVRQDARWKQQHEEQKVQPKPELRRINTPVEDGGIISVPVTEPAWLGSPVE